MNLSQIRTLTGDFHQLLRPEDHESEPSCTLGDGETKEKYPVGARSDLGDRSKGIQRSKPVNIQGSKARYKTSVALVESFSMLPSNVSSVLNRATQIGVWEQDNSRLHHRATRVREREFIRSVSYRRW